MSRPFVYEIDERSLRVKLKDLELPLKDDAWEKFDAFSGTSKPNSVEKLSQGFQISLNRNVMLPVVFGLVIVTFSILLFSFINIKNPAKAKTETEEMQAAVTETETIAAPEPKAEPVKAAAPAAADAVPQQPATVAVTMPGVTAEPPITSQAAVAGIQAPVKQDVTVTTTQHPARRIKNDPIEKLRPTVVTEDTETAPAPEN